MENIWKKFRRPTSTAGTSTPPQPNNLGLVTLRRQFREVSLSTTPLNQAEQEEKLYIILPLFYKVFKNSPAQDMREKFGDVLQFSTQVSRLMVSEIRRRASNKSTEQASVDIAKFLMPHTSEPGSRGWILMNTLSLLAAGGQNIVDCMTTMHLPSTLVKCLYLFFDLPSPELDSTVSENNKDALQGIFLQTLVRLCGYISPAEELSRKDDLALLFSAVTSWCSPHNTNWRNAASEVLITISRHGLSHNVVQYVRKKQCIKTCVNNLWRATVSLSESSPSDVLLDVDLAEQLLCVLRFISNTSDVTELLLDDFKQHQGYLFIIEFVIRLENAAIQSDSHCKALLSVIGAIEKLTTCGFNELSPDTVSQQSFQTNFVTPVPIGKGESVRNRNAFQVLETLFLRSRTTILGRAVLDAVFAVYCRDPANYFILSNLHTMSSFSERLSSKDHEIYPQYFAIFEYISLTLGFIPRKELVSLSLLLKTDSNVECSIACLRSLQKLLSSNLRTYKDVFREVGLFEMLIKCLQRYSALLKTTEVHENNENVQSEDITENHHAFGRLIMDVLVEMIQDSPTNAGRFRETGGARCVFNTLSYSECRYPALSLVEALILQPVCEGNDDDMATLLGVLSTLSLHNIQLKIDILKSLSKVVSKSNAGSLMFCNVGGFINLISIIVSMEGYLTFPPTDFWVQRAPEGFVLLETTFHILAATLSSPSNERYFESEVGYHSLLAAIKGLGCFSSNKSVFEKESTDSFEQAKLVFYNVPLRDQLFPTSSIEDEEVKHLRKVLCVFKLLYMVACDLFKDDVVAKIEKLSHSISKCSEFSDDSPKSLHSFSPGHVLHPNVITVFLQLLPYLSVQALRKEKTVSLQLYLLEQINTILNNERNEQILSEAGLLSTLLSSFQEVLMDDELRLNPVCQKILERLATQSVSPQELRKLLRVGSPLHCDNLFVNNGVVSLNRVKSLVSIATPRNVGMISDMSSNYKPLPSFVEFDMSIQGSSNLFIPSLFPQSASNPSAVGASALSEERVFPPAHGISVAVWFYVENFCNLQIHPVRLLTLERQVLTTHQNFTCFSINISPRRKRLIISTTEHDLNSVEAGAGDVEDSKETAGFNLEHVCLEEQWHHLQVTLQRSTVLKHSTVTAHFNGNLLGASKLRYISAYPGGSSQQALNSPIAVHAWVGTPSRLSARSSLVWRLASLRVFDEISSFIPNSAAIQTQLGPNYVGNYQTAVLPDGNSGPLFAEEHVCFYLLPSSVETVNYAFMQKTKLKLDFKFLAAKLNIENNLNMAPLDFFSNACVHTHGAARSIGAFAVGRKYKDAPRYFIPKGVGRVLQDVGGISVALYLVAMTSDVEGLYAAVKFLVCVLKSDDRAVAEVEQTKGYQALGMHLKEKKHLLNSHILHLTFSIAGTVDTGQEASTSVSNRSAFENLLCDLELWHNSPQELHKSLFDHFYELLTESSDTKMSHKIITGFNLVQRCVYFMYSDSSLSYQTINSIMKVIQAIFNVETHRKDLICFGQFAVSLISSSALSEKEFLLSSPAQDFSENQEKGKIDENILSKRTIHLRNIVLQLFLKCLTTEKGNTTFCESIESCLGFDWIMLFLRAHLHHSTITLSLQLLFKILQCSCSISTTHITAASATNPIPSSGLPGYSSAVSLIDRFRSGENFGGWLQGTEVLIDKKEDSLLGFNLQSNNHLTSTGCHPSVLYDAVPVPGFLALQYLISSHASSPQVLTLLFQFLLGQYDDIPSVNDFSLQNVQDFASKSLSKLDDTLKTLSIEILQLLNVILRQILHQNWKTCRENSWIQKHPLALVQALEMIYQDNVCNLSTMFVTSEFLVTFILSLFPSDDVVSFSTVSSPEAFLSLEGLLPSAPLADSKLSGHPTTGRLYSFLCKILWDSVTSQRNKSHNHVIDIMFELPTDKCSQDSLKEYVTDVILHVIRYEVESLGDLIKSFHCATSVTHVASRIVDKVWQGLFNDDCKKIFYFIQDIIKICQKKSCTHALTSLYKTLFRIILYQLSRRHFTISEQMVVLDALHCLTTNRSIVFGPKCRDAAFLSSLCHCLFMISGDSLGKDFGVEAEQRQTTWHVTEVSKQPTPSPDASSAFIPGVPSTPQEKGQLLLSNASARVWSEMIASKKEILTETFKVHFHNLGSEQANLDSARIQIRDAAAKSWASYILTEKKGAAGGSKDSPQQQKLIHRLNVVLGGTRKPKKEFNNKLGKNITVQDSHIWTLNHISVVQSLVRLQHNEHEQEEKHMKQYSQKEWNQTASELTRERGVWGPKDEESLTKWTLDSTEGPCRMRKRMMRDETFYVRYPHRNRSQQDGHSTLSKHKKPTSKDSHEYYRRINCLSPYYNPENENRSSPLREQLDDGTPAEKASLGPESSSDELENDDTVILNLCLECQPNQSQTISKVNTLSGKENVACDICGLSVQRNNENGNSISEKKTDDLTSDSVATKDDVEDNLEITRQVKSTEIDDSTKNKSSGIVTSESAASLADNPATEEKDKQDNQTILKLLENGEKIRYMFRSARIQGLDVHEGLLLFGQEHYYIIDGFTMLKSREIRDISSLPGEHEPIIPSSTMPNQDTVKNDSSFSDRMCSKFSYSDIREVHKRRYLLQNISLEVFNKDGRNCLLVFPQGTRTKVYNKFLSYATTLSDRGKDSISGQRSGLSVEQQGPTLLNNLIGEKTVTSRWERGEISNFQYLMHLNTLAGRSYNDLMQYPVFPWIIADYESEALDLTNPKTFRDLSKPMGSQTESRLEQYKKRYKDWEELGGIETPPYHYGTHYSSAMIVASYLVRMEPFTQHFLRLQGGHFDLADRMFHSIKDSWISASQKNMADVKELIPEFFYLPEFLLNTNRFDLGQKQNGVQLDNVILPPWARGSPHEFIRAHREALECDYVSNHLHEWIDLIFGYKQKGESALESHNVFHHLFYEGEVDIYSIKDPLKRNATIGFINNFGQIPKQLFKRPHPQKKCRSDPSSGVGSSDDKVFYRHLDALTTGNPIKELHGPVGHIVPHDRGISAAEQGKMLIPPNHTRYISWGHKDLSVRVGYYESERAMQIFENLGCDEIACATMATERLLITGDKSTVVHVWEIPAVKDRNKTMTLVKSLYGHTKAVTSLAACASYGIVVSGSEDGSCILWDLNHLAFVRQLQHHNDCPISHICINEDTGTIVTCSGTNLYYWSINGQLIAFASALSSNARNQQITALGMTHLNEWDCEAVVTTGHSDGHVRFWGLQHVQVPETAELLDLQFYNECGATEKKLTNSVQHAMNAQSTPDTLSLASIGELAELPWNDVSNLELSQHHSTTNETTSPQRNNNVEAQKPSEQISLKWKQQLVLKGKVELPSFNGKSGNSCPSVTYITMSKDHEKLYVGDEEGRVFAWTCS